MNAPAARRVVFGHGHLEFGAVGEGLGLLNEALSKTLLSHDDGAVEVLQRAGDNFGGRGGLFVNQHGNREVGDQRRGHGGVGLHPFLLFAAGAYHFLPLIDEQIHDADRLLEQAAAIAPQVEDQLVDAHAVLEVANGLSELKR